MHEGETEQKVIIYVIYKTKYIQFVVSIKNKLKCKSCGFLSFILFHFVVVKNFKSVIFVAKIYTRLKRY